MKLSHFPLTLLPILALGCTEEKHSEPKPESTPASAPSSQPSSKPASAKAAVMFITPQDGSTVFSEVGVAMAVQGMTVRPAGEDIEDRTSGHHHILIDQPDGVPAKTPVPASEKAIHYGKGQTSTYLTMPEEGEHTLTLQFADGAHRSYGPELTKTIKVKVVPDSGERKVFFKSPKDGATVKGKVKIKMGVSGMKIRPAGEDILDKTSGHHHVIVDGKPVDIGAAVPANETHIHYGKGQTEAELELSPGKHTLTLQFADGAHASYGPKMSSTIEITVK